MHFTCLLVCISISCSLFAASQTFIPQGPAPLTAPILFGPPPGPIMNQNGAIEAFAINPGNPQNIYIAATSGGVWSTSNFGAYWTPLLDGQVNLSVNSIAFDPTDPTYKTLVVGTGISSSGTILSNSTTALGGPNPTGLYYTQDGGSTWSTIGKAEIGGQSVVSVLAFGPKIFAGTYEYINSQPLTGYGLFVSDNGGSTFTLSPTGGAGQLGPGPVTSLATNPANNNTMYAAVSAVMTFQDTALYQSLDGGSTWNSVFGAAESGGFINPAALTSMKIATGPSGSVALFVQQAFPANMAVFLSNDNGSSWIQLDTSSLPFSDINPSSRVSSISMDVNDPTVVYISGSIQTAAINNGFPGAVYRLKYTGGTTEITSLIVGADGSASHADTRASLSLADGSIIVSSDGGIALRTKANSAGGVWQNLVGQNLATLEAYSAAYDGNHLLILTASQDNGICVQNAPNQLPATQHFPSDGFQVFVDDVSFSPGSLYYFTSNQEAVPRQFSNLGGTISSSQSLQFNVSFNSYAQPMTLNRNNPQWIAVADSGADMSSNFDLYIAQSSGGLNFNATLAGQSAQVWTNFAYGTQDNLQALVACAPAAGLYFTSNASTTQLALLPAYATQSGNMYPEVVLFDPRSYQRFFVTDTIKLYQTVNSGTSFTTIAAVPANLAYLRSLEFISNNGVNALLVGGYSSNAAISNVAVADSDGSGTLSNWRSFGLGLPDVFVSQLNYNSIADVLVAGTWGR